MINSIFTTAMLLALSFSCLAESEETRVLEVVFDESPVVVKGRIIDSGVGTCDSREGPQSFYLIRVSGVLKGNYSLGDTKVCGATAPFLMTNEYIVSGRSSKENELLFDADGVILVVPPSEYYRLISYDSPIVSSGRGEAYAVAIREVGFFEEFSGYLKLSE